ncbi:MAG TPA: hypothetical protein VIT23_14575, partial [Terrimicrobiaceae bacterium]
MKSRSYFFVVVLVAGVLAVFIVLSIGRKSGVLVSKDASSSTTAKTRDPGGKAIASAQPEFASSRMIVDSPDGKSSPGDADGVSTASHAVPATPLKATVAAKAAATLTIGDKKITLEPNQVGGFPRQLVQQGQKVTVQMSYPDGSPGDLVVAGVLDGGQFENRQRVLPLHLDETRRVSFGYTVSQELGI